MLRSLVGSEMCIRDSGTFTYTPPADFIGEDTFDYTIVDPSGATDEATVSIEVAPDPDPSANNEPDASDDLVMAPAGSPATANLLANDTDSNGDSVTITDVGGQDPSAGPITITDPLTGDPAGELEVDPVTGVVTFTPEPGFIGTVQVPYTIDDGNGGTDTSTLTLQIVDPAPVAQDDINTTEFNQPTTGNVLTLSLIHI